LRKIKLGHLGAGLVEVELKAPLPRIGSVLFG
jgi:hypothetical protein